MEEKEGDLEGEAESGQVHRPHLIVELAPREFRALHESRDLVPAVVRGERRGTWLHGIAIALRQHVGPLPKGRHRFAVPERWRANCLHCGHRFRIAGLLRLRHLTTVVQLLVTPLVDLRAKSGLSDPGQPADTDAIRRRSKDDPSP